MKYWPAAVAPVGMRNARRRSAIGDALRARSSIVAPATRAGGEPPRQAHFAAASASKWYII
jgi:hypothetical protein